MEGFKHRLKDSALTLRQFNIFLKPQYQRFNEAQTLASRRKSWMFLFLLLALVGVVVATYNTTRILRQRTVLRPTQQQYLAMLEAGLNPVCPCTAVVTGSRYARITWPSAVNTSENACKPLLHIWDRACGWGNLLILSFGQMAQVCLSITEINVGAEGDVADVVSVGTQLFPRSDVEDAIASVALTALLRAQQAVLVPVFRTNSPDSGIKAGPTAAEMLYSAVWTPSGFVFGSCKCDATSSAAALQTRYCNYIPFWLNVEVFPNLNTTIPILELFRPCDSELALFDIPLSILTHDILFRKYVTCGVWPGNDQLQYNADSDGRWSFNLTVANVSDGVPPFFIKQTVGFNASVYPPSFFAFNYSTINDYTALTRISRFDSSFVLLMFGIWSLSVKNLSFIDYLPPPSAFWGAARDPSANLLAPRPWEQFQPEVLHVNYSQYFAECSSPSCTYFEETPPTLFENVSTLLAAVGGGYTILFWLLDVIPNIICALSCNKCLWQCRRNRVLHYHNQSSDSRGLGPAHAVNGKVREDSPLYRMSELSQGVKTASVDHHDVSSRNMNGTLLINGVNTDAVLLHTLSGADTTAEHVADYA
jgi:hypothetical protein